MVWTVICAALAGLAQLFTGYLGVRMTLAPPSQSDLRAHRRYKALFLTVGAAGILAMVAMVIMANGTDRKLTGITQTLGDIKKENLALKTPAFHVTIRGVAAVSVPSGAGESLPCLVVLVSVKNTGAPSAISDTRLTAQPGGRGRVISGTPQFMPDQVQVRCPDGTSLSFPAKAALDTVQPIPTNKEASGVLLYAFPGVSVRDLKLPGTTYELAITDMQGRRYVGSRAAEGMFQSVDEMKMPPGVPFGVARPSRASRGR